MKNLVIAFLFTISFAALSYGQVSGQLVSTGYVHARIAVLDFSSDPGVTGIDAEGIKALQNAIVKEMKKDPKDKGWIEIPSTSSAAVSDLYHALLGRSVDTATAVKIGKLLGVNYVVNGHVKVFSGVCNVRVQIVDVARGKIGWTGEASPAGVTKTGAGTLEINPEPIARKTKAAMAELLRKTLEK